MAKYSHDSQGNFFTACTDLHVFSCVPSEWLNVHMTRKETSFLHVLILFVFLDHPSNWLNVHMTHRETSFPHILILYVFLGFPCQWLNIHMTRMESSFPHVIILNVFLGYLFLITLIQSMCCCLSCSNEDNHGVI